jgi:large conductance mechanosensitive channel
MSMIQEFKAFAMKGNVLDLAIGVIIGGAFGTIVNSLVGDVFMPIIGILTGGINFSGLSLNVGEAAITYGKFLQAVFVFLITAWALFLVVKAANAMKKQQETKPTEPPPPSQEVVLLKEIRDALKAR